MRGLKRKPPLILLVKLMNKILVLSILGILSSSGLLGAIDQKCAPIDVLYHGSKNKYVKIFEPRANHTRDLSDGKVIFATPSLKLASCYLFEWDDSWVHQSVSWKQENSGYEVFMVISDMERLKKIDMGGSVYLLPIESFSFSADRGLGIYEWMSKENIEPLSKIDFFSALDAMKQFKVKVYSLSSEQFKRYLELSGEKQETYLKETGVLHE